jgi:hypothetical protein
MSLEFRTPPHPALVSRAPASPEGDELFLVLTPAGQAHWTPEPAAATPFQSMREAARAALRLPSALRAFSVPAPQLH